MAEAVRENVDLSGYRDMQLVGALASAVMRAANHPALTDPASRSRMDRESVVATLEVLLNHNGEWLLGEASTDPDVFPPQVPLTDAATEFARRMTTQAEEFGGSAQ